MNLKAFNNLMIWRMPDDQYVDFDTLQLAMCDHTAHLPSAMQLEAFGWSSPLGETARFVERVSPGVGLVNMAVAKRLLPGKVVRQEVERQARKLAEDEGRKVFAREKQRIKEAVLAEMLPAAFIDVSHVPALIAPPYLFIGTSSAKTCETMLSLLRETLGSFKAAPVSVRTTPISTYTRWFIERRADHERFQLGDKFTLHERRLDSETVKGSWPFSDDETLSDWVANEGHRVSALGLQWHSEALEDWVPFQINEMLSVKGLKWPQSLTERAMADAGEDEDPHTLLLSILAILAPEMRKLLSDLLDALGGEQGAEEPTDEELI